MKFEIELSEEQKRVIESSAPSHASYLRISRVSGIYSGSFIDICWFDCDDELIHTASKKIYIALSEIDMPNNSWAMVEVNHNRDN